MDKCPVRKCFGGFGLLARGDDGHHSVDERLVLKTLSAKTCENDVTRRCRRVTRFAYWISGASERDSIPAQNCQITSQPP